MGIVVLERFPCNLLVQMENEMEELFSGGKLCCYFGLSAFGFLSSLLWEHDLTHPGRFAHTHELTMLTAGNKKKASTPQISCLTSESHTQLDFLPDKLRTKLLPFQKDGVVFALRRDGSEHVSLEELEWIGQDVASINIVSVLIECMVADEMGLGKTIQAIAIAYFYKEEWPLLIVVPSSLRYPWVEELEKWIPELEPEEINVVMNKTDIGRIPSSRVTVLGYGLLTPDAGTLLDALNSQDFRVVVVDESHYMKSRTAARSRILLPMVQKARRAILLTGTPALGRPEELFMQIEALFPQKFGTWIEYAKRYCNAHIRYFGKRRQWDCRGASNLSELHQLLNDIMIRRLKSEVLSQLPPKVRQRIPFDLPPAAVKELNASFEEWQKLMRAPNSGAMETVMGLITRMFKQTAIAKGLTMAGAVKDYIKMLLQNDSLKFLVFAHHLSMLQACTEAVIESKSRYIRIDGSVPSSERIHLVNQFQKDPDTRVAILSIQAAGQGLTFTAASHVVFAELYWDPGHIKQAEDRAHRIGQCSSVNIHYLIANGTLDSLMWAMLNRKSHTEQFFQQAQVTGSTLNGRKERLQATEDDKEKWGFLQFAEAWTPSDSFEELKDSVFTHDLKERRFEKEKQHDIRSFFLPKPKKRQLETPCDESEAFKEKITVAPDPGKMAISDGTADRNGPEPEAKRLRSLSTKDHSSALEERPSLQAKATSMGGVHEIKSPLASPALPEKGWQCGFCTFLNDPGLSYCEMCENPQGRAAECTGSEAGLNHSIQSNNKNDEAASQNCTSENDQASSGCVKQLSEQSGAEQSANNEEETLKEILGEDTTKKILVSSDEEISMSDHLLVEQLSNSGTLPEHETFLFCASRNTDRIHIYTKVSRGKDGKPMNCNFIPLDIKLDLWEDLPATFQRKQNRSLILRLVREWSGLTAMKQRIIRKSGQLFCSPVLALEEITKQQTKEGSTRRYITKEDVATASMNKVKNDGGHVRLITKGPMTQDPSTKKLDGACVPSLNPCPADLAAEPSPSKGYIQAVDKEGRPLCLRCQHPTCQPEQGAKTSAWDSRFCSLKCQEEFWIRSNNSYLRAQVFAVEHGVCQLCGVNAQELFLRMRDAPKSQRKSLLGSAWTAKLPLEQVSEGLICHHGRKPGSTQADTVLQKELRVLHLIRRQQKRLCATLGIGRAYETSRPLNEMLRSPGEGHFWQVDHIRPVYEGGGQCSLENLQTLCTVCHKEKELPGKPRKEVR
ncbi:DNA annealing helicase and endonuclease ZRANB3 [Apodemus speciosus]|uniref:DNA annealing helicase and endonuclease ZRANB3 n=1 Tax=Apodemus speciosus TaxID=105296 RepID=A0ABQ0EET8_APOSI